MNYKWEDLGTKAFNKKMNGYSKTEVNDLLYKVVEDYQAFEAEISDLKSQLKNVQENLERYIDMEETLRQTVHIAQQTSDDIRKNAENKALNIILEAENKARNIVNTANDMAMKIRYDYDDFKKKSYLYRSNMMNILETQMELLKRIDEGDDTKSFEVKKEDIDALPV